MPRRASSQTSVGVFCRKDLLVEGFVDLDQGDSVAGTMFADSRPRLVRIKGIEIEADLGPHMLYITNKDVPGIIGHLGTALAEAGVNIATFHLGRAARGGDAIALIEVDEALDEQVLAAVRAIDGISQAKALRF